MRLYSSFLLILTLFAIAARADERKIDLIPVPSLVTGTFAPFSVSVDSQPVIQIARAITSLTLNGSLVKAGRFFRKTDADTLELIYSSESAPEKLLKIELPRVSSIQLDPGSVTFKLAGPSCTARLDGRELRGATLALPNSDAWYRAPHVLELKPLGRKPGRLYTLKFPSGKLVVVARGAVVSVGRSPAGTSEAAVTSAPSLTAFRFGLLAAVQSADGNSVGPLLSWNPSFALSPDISLVANTALSAFKADNGDTFAVGELGLFLGLSSGQLRFEAGGGAQLWAGHGGAHPLAALNARYRLDAGIVDSIVIGYSAFFFPQNFANEIRVGVGFAL